MTQAANASQAEFWNGEVGERWVAFGGTLEALTGEVARALLARAAPRPGERVLEVGCGGGALSLDLARAVGPGGRVLGLDVSRPLLARARARAAAAGLAQVELREADAQETDLAPGAFDLLVSHFGAMFFADPVAAFRNLGRAMRPGGRVHLAAWGPVAENPFFRLAGAAAAGRLGSPAAPPDPFAPGPFAFADRDRVVSLLAAAGLVDVSAEAADVSLTVPGGAEAAASLSVEIGPAVRMLREAGGTDADRAAIRDALRDALRPYEAAEGLRVPARVNLFAAVRP